MALTPVMLKKLNEKYVGKLYHVWWQTGRVDADKRNLATILEIMPYKSTDPFFSGLFNIVLKLSSTTKPIELPTTIKELKEDAI